MSIDRSSAPTNVKQYLTWYENTFSEDLNSGIAEQWYGQAKNQGQDAWEKSAFWKALRTQMPEWDSSFADQHNLYRLFGELPSLCTIETKSFGSVLDKSLRWNVRNNEDWELPPKRLREGAEDFDSSDPRCLDDPRWWYGPHNWLETFPDIFRIRLIATYMDGVRYLAERIKQLAKETIGECSPMLKFRHSNDGYHAVHLNIRQRLDGVWDYTGEHDTVETILEIQVTTTIQSTIDGLLHKVYETSRLKDPPDDWAWDYRNPAFSVNYLGSTLHYLEGMIVAARVAMEERQ